MLIRFKVANFLSFKEETEFSMIAGRERIHPTHVVKGKKNQPNLLRAALLYGANAAGKSNFVKAIEFAKRSITERGFEDYEYIIDKTSKADISNKISSNRFKFRLNSNYSEKPSEFFFEFISNKRVFQYSFAINSSEVTSEKLLEIKNNSERLLFERYIDDKDLTNFTETNFLNKKDDIEFLRFVQKSTKNTELFLSHSADNNVEWFKDAFEWFYYSLKIIFPFTKDFRYGKRLYENEEFKNFFINLLSKSGTGITSVELKKNKNPNLLKVLDVNHVTSDFVDVAFLHNRKTIFDEREESDGTKRLFDFAYPLYDLASSETSKVYIIDELESSLHTNLSYMLLKSFLEQEGKGQLIATTHDTHLLDLELLRKDEIWFAEKDEEGATQLYSLYDFKPRYDKNVEKDYLLGRFGAIPFLGNLEFKRQLAKNGNSDKNGEN